MNENTDNSSSRIISTLFEMSIFKTLFYSIKLRGLIIVGKHSRIRVKGKILFSAGGLLIVGIDSALPGGSLVEVATGGILEISGRVHVRKGARITVGKSGNLSIGAGTHIGERPVISCVDRIKIGSNCTISWDNNIMDSDMHFIIRGGEQLKSIDPVSIGDNVWIGLGTTVLKGVTVGDWAIIGAKSLVTKDIPEGTLSVGSPTKVIATDIKWSTIPKY